MKVKLDYQFLKELTQAYGPSGNEHEVADLIENYLCLKLNKCPDQDIRRNPLGNLIIHKPGKGKKILLVCHMDEVAVIVTHISKQGYLYFSPVGGIKNQDLLSKRVMFKNRHIGVIWQEKDLTGERKSSGKFYIDLGVSSEEEARRSVHEGDMAVLVGGFEEKELSIMAKALDDRVGCFISLEIFKQIESENDLYFAFTVQEEVGSRGAKTLMHQLEPDLALILDTTISFDTPKEKNQTSLGQGVAIKVLDRSIVVLPKIKDWMANIAKQNNIPFQWEIIQEGGTDAGPVHLSHSGIPTGGLALPVRYLHSGSELISKQDIQAAADLLFVLLKDPLVIDKAL